MNFNEMIGVFASIITISKTVYPFFDKKSDSTQNISDFVKTKAQSELSKQKHKYALEEIQKISEAKTKEAEERLKLKLAELYNNIEAEKYIKFMKEFPLINPYDIRRNFKGEVNFNWNEDSKKIRIVVALDNTNKHRKIIYDNKDFSDYILTHYSQNKNYGVISKIGAWKDEIKPTEARIMSILYEGFKDLPVLVIDPHFSGNNFKLGLYSWSPLKGDNSPEYNSIEFNCDCIELLALLKESEYELKKIKNLDIHKEIFDLLDKDDRSKYDYKDVCRKIKKLFQKYAIKIRDEDLLNRKEKIFSYIYICITSMYIDQYYLFEYGELPKLPKLLAEMEEVDMLLPQIYKFYVSCVGNALKDNVLSISDSINILNSLSVSLKKHNSSKYCNELSMCLKDLENLCKEEWLIIDKNPQKGETVKLGKYYYDSGKERDIEWIVIDKDESQGTALLLSKYCIDRLRYNDKLGSKVAWEESSIRRFLNDVFYKNAFKDTQKKEFCIEKKDDKVFLLGKEEAESLEIELKQTEPTPYALSKANPSDKKIWWTRDCGHDIFEVACIGGGVIPQLTGATPDSNNVFVRAAIKVKIEEHGALND